MVSATLAPLRIVLADLPHHKWFHQSAVQEFFRVVTDASFTIASVSLNLSRSEVRFDATDAAGNRKQASLLIEYRPQRIFTLSSLDEPIREGGLVSLPITLQSLGETIGATQVVRYGHRGCGG